MHSGASVERNQARSKAEGAGGQAQGKATVAQPGGQLLGDLFSEAGAVGRCGTHPLTIDGNRALQQGAVGHSAKTRLDPAWDRDIQHRSLQLIRTHSRLARLGEAEQGNGGSQGHQQGTAMPFEETGTDPARLEILKIHSQGHAGPWGAGMAAHQATGLGLVTTAGAEHPAGRSGHQHGRSRSKTGQSGGGEADAAGASTGVKGTAEGAEEGAPGTAGEALIAADRNQAVFDDRPMQQQPCCADTAQIQG